MTTRTPTFLLVCAASIGLVGCARRLPELTEERVLENLGKDELILTFATMDERFIGQYPCAPEVGPITSWEESDEDHITEAVGWTEDVCKGDPRVIRLTSAGHLASARWPPSTEPHAANELRRWDVVVARYQRSGPPESEPARKRPSAS